MVGKYSPLKIVPSGWRRRLSAGTVKERHPTAVSKVSHEDKGGANGQFCHISRLLQCQPVQAAFTRTGSTLSSAEIVAINSLLIMTVNRRKANLPRSCIRLARLGRLLRSSRRNLSPFLPGLLCPRSDERTAGTVNHPARALHQALL